MATFEMVEKIRQYANVTYDEAKAALEACDDDLLEAVIYLEKQGKVAPPPQPDQHSAGSGAGPLLVIPQPPESKDERRTRRKAAWNGFWAHVGDILGKGFTNKFEISRKDELILTLPVIVLIALVLFCFPVTVFILILGLFLSCRYRFYGPEVDKTAANHVMDSAAETAENLKNQAQKMYEQHKAEAEAAQSGEQNTQS